MKLSVLAHVPTELPELSLPLFAILVVLQFTLDHVDHYFVTD